MLTPIVALFLLVASAGAASAAPIAAAIVGFIGLTGAAASIATAVIGLGLSLGASVLLSSILKPAEPDAGSAAALGATAELRFGSRVAHELAIGEVLTAGHYVYWNTHGENRRYLDQVYVLASGWCDSLTGLYVNGEAAALVEVDAGIGWTKYAVTLPGDGGTRRLWVTFWEGRHDQQASPALVASANPAGRWTTDHRGRGMCYVHVEADYDASLEAFRGLLNGSALKFRFRGLRLYDARLDTTAGGSGPQRFDDWTTWAWSDNPAVACHHYQLGYYIDGVRVGGMGLPAYDLATAHYMAAANICDELVPVPGDVAERRYRVAMFASDEVEAVDVVDRLVSAMGGERLERDGIHAVLAGAAQVPVAAITDDDLIVGQSVSFSSRLRREDLVNEIYGQYAEPDQLFEAADIEPVIGGAALKAEDGGETRPATVTLAQVPSATQARRLVLISFRRGRCQARASITLGLEARVLEVGDWITWRGRTWVVSATALSTSDDVIALTLVEVAASVYAVGEGDVTVVPLPPTPPAEPARPTNVAGLMVQPSTVSGADGQKLPALRVGWDAVTDETIRTVEVEYRLVGEAGAGERRTVTRPASGAWDGTVITGGLMAGTDYEVRTTITTQPIRRVTWSDWRPVTTQGELVVPSAGSLYDQATGEARSAGEQFADVRSAALASIQRLLSDNRREGVEVTRQVRESERSRASIEETRLLIADEAVARAVAITELASQITDPTTGLPSKASVTQLAATNASVADLSAMWGVEVEVDGVTGRAVLTALKRNDGSVFVDYGIRADRFSIVDPSNDNNAFAPFVFDQGTAYLSELVALAITADSITTGVLRSANGKVFFDLDNGVLRVTS